MAEPLKNMYNPVFFERILPLIKEEIPLFNERDFVYHVFDSQWPELELKQRVKKIAGALKLVMPDDFCQSASLLVGLSRRFLAERICVQGFELIFIPEYIGLYGSNHVSQSLQALREVTRLVSGEFAIRPFLRICPEATMTELANWAVDGYENVRRLASEGCRPRLPWGAGVPWLKENPEKILPVLDVLRADRSPYVRRSVANNLNDIAKDHPELVRKTVAKWKGTNPLTDEIIRHGCRTLFKKGDPQSLMLHGINPGSKSELIAFKLSPLRVKVGGELVFRLRLRNSEKKPTRFLLDYAIDFQTSTGRKSAKVFRMKEILLNPDSEIELTRKQSFRDLTTRKHFQGRHSIHIIVNGVRRLSRDFFIG